MASNNDDDIRNDPKRIYELLHPPQTENNTGKQIWDNIQNFANQTLKEDGKLILEALKPSFDKVGKKPKDIPDKTYLGWDYKKKEIVFVCKDLDDWYYKYKNSNDPRYQRKCFIPFEWDTFMRFNKLDHKGQRIRSKD